MTMAPASRPKQTREETLAILKQHDLSISSGLVLLGVCGYYEDSMGVKGENDQAMYDDALFAISMDRFASFNFNTDPQKAGHKLAKLDSGLYTFHKGLHKGKYKCLRPYPEDARWPCTRDGVKSMCGAIQIHMGGFNDTFSEGCQTIYKPQYNEAMLQTIYPQMTKYGQSKVPYLLIEN